MSPRDARRIGWLVAIALMAMVFAALCGTAYWSVSYVVGKPFHSRIATVSYLFVVGGVVVGAIHSVQGRLRKR